MSSNLIISSQDPTTKLNYLHHTFKVATQSPDTLIHQTPESIGINFIRYIQDFSLTPPKTSPTKSIAILNSSLLTIPAQNALLKILEEHPQYLHFYLFTHNPKHLLSTIRSRCQLHHCKPTPTKSTLNPPPSTNLFAFVDKLSQDKSLLNESINHWIAYYRHHLIQQPNQSNLYNLTLCLYVNKLIRANTNPKLALDYLFLNLKQSPTPSS